ncbi:MAG TPA: cytochrome c [Gemmatimonadaceae bacterium]|nr:cytochrome c [Gemmatimonadaceae bacterium]
MHRVLPIALAALMIAAHPAAAVAQNGVPTSTRHGVYTRTQALRGEDIYAGNCRSCHTPESHTGSMFRTRWDGRPLSELYLYIVEAMPKADPGSLSPQEYADVLAYLLRLNRMPQGDADLPADPAALKTVRIETEKSP